MALQDYLRAREQLDRTVATREHIIRTAYDAGLSTTVGEDGLVNLEKLTERESRSAFRVAMENTLRQHLLSYFGIQQGANFDILRYAQLEAGVYGQPIGRFGLALEELKGEFTFQRYMQTAQQGLERVTNEVLRTALLSTLRDEDKEVALAHVGIINRVNKDLIRVTDLVELLELFRNYGVIPPRWLERQHYYTGEHRNGAHPAAGFTAGTPAAAPGTVN